MKRTFCSLHKRYCIYKLQRNEEKVSYNFDKKRTRRVVIDRDILTTREHIDLLAQPKYSPPGQVHRPEVCYYYVKKNLPETTAYVNRLATPLKRTVISNYEQYGEKQSARHINNLFNFIFNTRNEYTEIDKAINEIKANKLKKQIKRKKILKKIAEIKRKTLKTRQVQIKQIIYSLFAVMKPFLMTAHNIEMTEKMMRLSGILLQIVASFFGYELPSRGSSNVIDKFLVMLADNLCIWVQTFIVIFGFTVLRGSVLTSEEKPVQFDNGYKDMLLHIEDFIEKVSVGEEQYKGEQEEFIENEGAEEEFLKEIHVAEKGKRKKRKQRKFRIKTVKVIRMKRLPGEEEWMVTEDVEEERIFESDAGSSSISSSSSSSKAEK